MTWETPYVFIFRGETIPPLEIQLPSLRATVREAIRIEERTNLRVVELEALGEDRLIRQQNLELHQRRMSNAFNKHIPL